MQRAAISMMSNIAEGYERGGNQEFSQFLYIAKGSCGEAASSTLFSIRSGLCDAGKRLTICSQLT